MTRAADNGVLIGICDIHGNEIGSGNRIRVQHITYKDTPREHVDEEFIARVSYHISRAAFLYTQEDVPEEDQDDHTYHFNHRSSRFEILESN